MSEESPVESPRGNGEQVRDAAISAARNAFAAGGYARTTFKGLAAAAGVAPTVLRKYYDSKDAVFAAALKLPTDPASAVPALLAPGVEGLGERLVRFTLDTLDDPAVRDDLTGAFPPPDRTGLAEMMSVRPSPPGCGVCQPAAGARSGQPGGDG